ncbi:MAG: protein O-mannosyl-transferase family, partial [Verrucomicrobiota bacterium]
MEKPKLSTDRDPSALPPRSKAAPIEPPLKLPPLFRKVDWLTLGITFLAVFVGYCLTLAPEMTLEDSGELAVGSFYAGIPHPPGYPIWTLYTYLWTLIPFGNVAWRVGLGCAFSGALASGLLALVVSRGSSMIVESIDDLKALNRRWEGAICVVSGFVAGALLGFNGYMWSQSVIVEVYPLSVVSLLGVVVCLMRWIYAPHQHRYLYWAFFLFGICVNNHQSLLVIAMGVEVVIWLAEPKLGRELFFWNTLIYALGLIAGPTLLTGNASVFVIFNLIGIASAALWIWLVIKTKKSGIEFARDGLILAVLGCIGAFFGGTTNYIPSASSVGALLLVALAGIVAAVFLGRFIQRTWHLSKEWLIVLISGCSWLAGCAFYLFMPISGMTNPPMQWGYPRTLDGFIHAITRGQSDKIHPTSGVGNNAFEIVGSFFSTYGMQLWRFLEGLN